MPSRGVLGQPASTNNFRTPLENVNKRPTIVELPMRNRWVSRLAICRLAPDRFASPARTVNVETSHSMPEVLSKSFEFFNDKYSANCDWPAARARLSASASASAQASSSSLTAFLHFAVRVLAANRGRWYHEPRIVPPKLIDIARAHWKRSPTND